MRANVLYDTIGRPPEYGTLLEAALLLVWNTRQRVDIAEARAIAQAALGGEKAIEAFKDYQSLATRTELEDRASKMREQMQELSKIQEIRFKPLAEPARTMHLPVYRAEPKDIPDNLRPVSARTGRAVPAKRRRS